MTDVRVQIRMGEGDAVQLAAWDRLWKRLLSPGEPSNDIGAKESPAPVDKTESGPSAER